MKLDERLASSLGPDLDRIEVPAGDLMLAMATGRSRRRRGAAVTSAIAIALALIAAIAVSQFGRADPVEELRPWGTWREVAPAPLSPRIDTIATWTGQEAMFWGGFASPLTCGRSECASPDATGRQGVAFEPTSQTWRSLAKAPFVVSTDLPYAQVGDQLVVQNDRQEWWSFWASTDRWERLPDAPEVMVGTSTTVQGQRVYAVGNGLGDHINVYDTVSRAWSSLPVSQHTPRLGDRHLIATDRGVLAIGRVYGESPDGYTPLFQAEFFDGGQWNRVSDDVRWPNTCCWQWVGDRLVVPQKAGSATTSLEALGVLTEVTPKAGNPESRYGWRAFAVAGSLMTINGVVYDDHDQTWSSIARPAGAPEIAGASVWADGQLITIEARRPAKPDAHPINQTSRAWIYTHRL